MLGVPNPLVYCNTESLVYFEEEVRGWIKSGELGKGQGRRSFPDFGLDQTSADVIVCAVVVVSRAGVILATHACHLHCPEPH